MQILQAVNINHLYQLSSKSMVSDNYTSTISCSTCCPYKREDWLKIVSMPSMKLTVLHYVTSCNINVFVHGLQFFFVNCATQGDMQN